MNKRLTNGILGCAAAVAVCLAMGCESNDTTAQWQPGEAPYFNADGDQWWHFKFVYYPQDEIYFQPYTGQFFWFEDGAWRSGDDLPMTRNIRSIDAEVVRSRYDLPFFEHLTHAQLHPNPKTMPDRINAQKAGQSSFALFGTKQNVRTAADVPGVKVFRPNQNKQFANAPENHGRN